jgi:hypothetical protein
MSNFFGFHGEKPGAGPVTRKLKRSSVRKSAANSSTNGTPMMVSNPLAQPNPSQMTYNGVYNMAAVAPPPLNSKPPRKITGNGNRPQTIFAPNNLNSPSSGAQYLAPQPVNGTNGNNRNRLLPLLTPAPPGQNPAFSDLQSKISQWKAKKRTPGAGLTVVNAKNSQKALDKEPEISDSEEKTQVQADLEDQKDQDEKDQDQKDQHQKEQDQEQGSMATDLRLGPMLADLESLKTEVSHVKSVIKNSQSKKLEQEIQKLRVDQNHVKTLVEQLQMITKSQQNDVDSLKKEPLASVPENLVTDKALEDILEGWEQEIVGKVSSIEEKIKTTLQSISDRGHWLYGTVVSDSGVSCYEEPLLNGRVTGHFEKGQKVLLTYPMQTSREGTWIKCRFVNPKSATITVSWVPIQTFSDAVLKKFPNSQPPGDQETVSFLGQFSLN